MGERRTSTACFRHSGQSLAMTRNPAAFVIANCCLSEAIPGLLRLGNLPRNDRHGWIPDNHAYSVISGMTVMEVLLRYLDTSIHVPAVSRGRVLPPASPRHRVSASDSFPSGFLPPFEEELPCGILLRGDIPLNDCLDQDVFRPPD